MILIVAASSNVRPAARLNSRVVSRASSRINRATGSQARAVRCDQRAKLLACLLGCGYSLHRDAPGANGANRKAYLLHSSRVHPNLLFQQTYAFAKIEAARLKR